MNLFSSILKKTAPKIPNPRDQFLVGFEKAPNVIQQPESKFSFIPNANAWEPIVSDDEIMQMIQKWATDEEIKILVSELEKERSPQQQPEAPEKSLMQKTWDFLTWFWEGTMNVVWWAVAQAPKVAGNVLWELSNLWAYTPFSVAEAGIKSAFSDKTYWQTREEQKKSGEPFKKLWQQWKEFVQKYGAYNPESTSSKVGETWTNILSTFVWPWKIFKTAEKANVAIKALASLANTSIEWTTAAITNYVATEGRMPTAKEVGEYIAVLWWMKIWGKIFEWIKKLPSARLIPTTITEAGRDIRKWIDIWEAISTTGISFTKWQLIKKIEKKAGDLSQKVDDAISKVIKILWPNNITIPSLTKNLKKEIMEDSAIKSQLKGTPIQMKQIEESIDETISAYNSLFKGKKLDLKAQQELKKDIYVWLENVFNKNFQTTGKITAQQATERQIARKLRANIEDKVPEVIELNKKLAPFLEAWKRLNAKWGYSGYLTDILAWWFAWWSPGWIIEDPVGYAKNFLLWVIAKRAWTSTLAKTSASTLTANIEKIFKNPTFQKAILDQYRQLNSNE